MQRNLYCLLFFVLILSLICGEYTLSELYTSQSLYSVLWHLRLPRALMIILTGGVLGLSGAVLQGYLRNHLADASVLGISSGGALGAVLCLFLSQPNSHIFIYSFVSSLLFAAILLNATTASFTLLLGIAINSLTYAVSSLLLSLSKNPYAALEIVYWFMGSFDYVQWDQVLLAIPLMLLGCVLFFRTGYAIDALSLGQDTARSMGVSIKRTHKYIVIGIALTVGVSIAFVGTIGFVGLIAPHLLRPFTHRKPSTLFLPSFLAGSNLLLVSDIFARFLHLKIGIMTSLIGSPLFIWLLYKYARSS